jgi:hypothetical protein
MFKTIPGYTYGKCRPMGVGKNVPGKNVFAGFELSKNKWGLTSAYSLSLSLHTGDIASLTTAGVETMTPRVSQGILFGG